MQNKAIVLFGPTGVGKTALSLKLANMFSGEIISVDSRQVYRHMDIGTAKVTKEEQSIAKHHLIDVVNPDESFTAGDFKRFCENEIPAIWQRESVPFLVGGTGFYFNTLMNGIVSIPQVDEGIRSRIETLQSRREKTHIYRMIEFIDPEIAGRFHVNDTQRISRALEVFFGTGKRLSDYYKDERETSLDAKYLKIGLNYDRAKLYERINARVDIMIDDGLVDEVERLISLGYKSDDCGMKTIGYAEIFNYFSGKCSLETAIDRIKQNSRHYAKRQLTWFRAVDDVNWFDPFSDEQNIVDMVARFLSDD